VQKLKFNPRVKNLIIQNCAVHIQSAKEIPFSTETACLSLSKQKPPIVIYTEPLQYSSTLILFYENS
jgi:hypothetical protein